MLLRYSTWHSFITTVSIFPRPVRESEVALNCFGACTKERHNGNLCYHFEWWTTITEWHRKLLVATRLQCS